MRAATEPYRKKPPEDLFEIDVSGHLRTSAGAEGEEDPERAMPVGTADGG